MGSKEKKNLDNIMLDKKRLVNSFKYAGQGVYQPFYITNFKYKPTNNN